MGCAASTQAGPDSPVKNEPKIEKKVLVPSPTPVPTKPVVPAAPVVPVVPVVPAVPAVPAVQAPAVAKAPAPPPPVEPPVVQSKPVADVPVPAASKTASNPSTEELGASRIHSEESKHPTLRNNFTSQGILS